MSTNEKQDDNGNRCSETQIAPVYGKRNEINEMVFRLKAGLPNARDIPNDAVIALATASYAHDLDPWNGEIHIIHNKNTGETALMVGIKGLRKAARRQLPARDSYTVNFRPIPKAKYPEYGLGNDVELAEICTLARTDVTARHIELLEKMKNLCGDYQTAFDVLGRPPTFEGIGIVLKADKSRMPRVQLVRKRAEAHALKQAFDLPFVTPGAPDDEDVVNGEVWETNNGGKPELKLVPPPAEPEPEAKAEEPSEEPEAEKEPEKPKANPGPGPEKKAGSPKPKAEQKPSKPKKQATPPKVKTPGKPTQEDIDYLLEEFVPGSWKIAADTLNTIFGTKYTAETLKAGLKKHHGYLTDEDLEKVQLRWKAAVTLAQFDTSAFKKVADAAEGEAQGELF